MFLYSHGFLYTDEDSLLLLKFFKYVTENEIIAHSV